MIKSNLQIALANLRIDIFVASLMIIESLLIYVNGQWHYIKLSINGQFSYVISNSLVNKLICGGQQSYREFYCTACVNEFGNIKVSRKPVEVAKNSRELFRTFKFPNFDNISSSIEFRAIPWNCYLFRNWKFKFSRVGLLCGTWTSKINKPNWQMANAILHEYICFDWFS